MRTEGVRKLWNRYKFVGLLVLLGAGLLGVLPPYTTALLHNGSTMALCAASMRPYLPE